MALAPKKGSLLLAALLFGTFGLHALYQARAQSPAQSAGSPLVQPLRIGETTAAPPPVEAGDGRVRLTATADRSAVLQNGDGVVHVEVTLQPEATPGAAQRTPTDLVVVMDHSGSMQGAKWEAADWSVERFLSGLTEQDTFALGVFHDRPRWLTPTPQPATPAAVRTALPQRPRRGPGGAE